MNIKISMPKVTLGLCLFLCFWLALSQAGSIVLASSLPQSELQALEGWPNWVADQCSASNNQTATSSTPVKGGVEFDDSQSSDTGNQTTYDEDGYDAPTGGTNSSSTSYADGKLSAYHTNYIALNPGWAANHGLVLGDTTALTYKGKTIYAVYGDNHVGDTPHAEISYKADVALKGSSPADNLSGVHYAIYPNTHQKLNGSVDQSQIDQIGAQVSGGGAPSGGGTGSQNAQCACPGGGTVLSGNDNETKIWNYFIQKGLSAIQTAAIIGNLQQESSFNPEEIESDGNSKNPSDSGGGGWGLAQWTPGSKVVGIAQGLHISGPIYELATQLDVIWGEMNTSTPASYTGFTKAFKGINDLAQATDFFTKNYEAAGIVGPRFQYATDALKKFGNTATGSSSSGSATDSSGGGCTSSGGSSDINAYKNPLRDVKGLFHRRIDQGVDYGGHGPIYAIGNGVVDAVYHYGESSGWPGPSGGGVGGWVSYTLSDGPAKDKIVYFAESCQPIVNHGDKVTPDTVICNMNGDTNPWIETGWAASTVGSAAAAQALGGSCATDYGVNFSDLLKKLGAPAGIIECGGPNNGTLPSGWPTW